MNNPFRYGRVVGGEDFCPRPALQKQLEGYIRADQNASIQGERRMGKSSIALAAAKGVRHGRTLHVDLLGIRTAEDFCKRVAAAAGRLDKGDDFFRKTLRLLSRLRPSLKVDSMTGEPMVSIDASETDPADSIDAVFDMIAEHAGAMDLCVILDEFQDVLDMEDSETLVAQMRGRIQHLTHVCFLFLGSVRNRMYELFTDPRSPFFKSALLFEVGPIPDADFGEFIQSKFETGRRKIDDAALDAVFSCAGRTPGDIQQLCHALWETSDEGDRLDARSILRALDFVFAQESAFYSGQLRLLTAFQERVLVAAAAAGGVGTLSEAFMKAAGSANRSSVKKALSRLVDLGILFARDRSYRFNNPFFREWINRRL